MSSPRRRSQGGSTAVEMALVLPVWLTLVLGTVDVSRWLYALHGTSAALREGVRTASVCTPDNTAIAQRMQAWLSTTQAGTVSVSYEPSGCAPEALPGQLACHTVRVTLEGFTVTPTAPLVSHWSLPTLSAAMPRELLNSHDLPICN